MNFEKTTVWATDKNKFHKTGEEINTSKSTADVLIAKGFATEEAPAGSTKKAKK
jgi:hypothetical protein